MLTVGLLMKSCRRFRQFLLMEAQLHLLMSISCPCLQLELLEAWRRSCVLLLDTELLFLALLRVLVLVLATLLLLLEVLQLHVVLFPVLVLACMLSMLIGISAQPRIAELWKPT